MPTSCELCDCNVSPDWVEVVRDSHLRVLRVLDTPDFPAFYRVAWLAHVPELSDLTDAQRAHCMAAVVAVEKVMRDALAPTKMNVATLGNVLPHLHWHVIARFDWDSHYPRPIWGAPQREVQPPALQRLAVRPEILDARIHQTIGGLAATSGSILV